MKRLPIVWQRLVNAGETCDRCGSTGQAIAAALAKLAAALQPLGIRPVLETRAIEPYVIGLAHQPVVRST